MRNQTINGEHTCLEHTCPECNRRSRKSRTILLATIVVLCLSIAAEAKYCGGTGEPNNPYLICDDANMNEIGKHTGDWGAHFRLVADINLAGYTGTQFNIIGNSTTKFTGVFDGNDHKVWNFTWTSTGRSYIGLFGYVGTGGQIKNLSLENVNVDAGGSNYISSLVASNSGEIENCYSTGRVRTRAGNSGGYSGGLVAYNYGPITNCYSDANVTGGTGSGGLAGNNYGTITNCYSTGNVNGTPSGSGFGLGVGGLVAWNSGTITDCYSTGSVSGTMYYTGGSGNSVGGLVGRNEGGTISNCYSTGNVSVTGRSDVKLYVGGLVGNNNDGTITNCYSTGNVSGTGSDNLNYAGGLVGYNKVGEGMITYCYSTGSVSITGAYAHGFVGGLVGYGGGVVSSFWDIETSGRSTSAGGAHKTTAEMKMASTYIGWGGCDNNDIWTIADGNYPHLAWEGKPGQLIPEQHLSDYVDGNGIESDPYLISNDWQFNLIGAFPCEWDKHFKLVADINLADYTRTQFNRIGVQPCRSFTGVFDGNDHKIWNFTWDSNSVSYIGLFGYVDSSGQIKNVGMENVNINISDGNYVSGLVGYNQQGMITNCYSIGSVISGGECLYSLWIGGLVGYNYEGTITNCYSIGIISGLCNVGGLVGDNGGTISNSYATGSVSKIGYAQEYSVGGLVATNSGTITNCYSIGSVSESPSDSRYPFIGGLVGSNYGTIMNCYSTEDVNGVGGNGGVGGLVGYNYGTITDCNATSEVSGAYDIGYTGGLVAYNSGTISNCYATGRVSGSHRAAGGLVAESTGTITNCYSTGIVSGDNYAGGLVGVNHDTIANCYSTGNVSGSYMVGGLVGNNVDGSTITNCCYSVGSVSGDDRVGGLVGCNDSSTITKCYSTGEVIAVNGANVGGLVGSNLIGTITNCYSAGSVTGSSDVGGLVGDNYYGDINNCYSTGNVDGNEHVGGLVGYGNPNDVNASFWDVNTSGQANSPGGGEGKTTTEMKDIDTFLNAGWDFVCETTNGTEDIWTIYERVDYPKLVWQWKDYQEWLDVNKPPCWCYKRQCHGDADNTSEYVKGKGYYYVHFNDMGLLLSAWDIKEPPDGPGIKWPDPNICADFAHDKEYIKGQGYYRVHYKDMGILLANYNVLQPPQGSGIDPNCLDCP